MGQLTILWILVAVFIAAWIFDVIMMWRDVKMFDEIERISQELIESHERFVEAVERERMANGKLEDE